MDVQRGDIIYLKEDECINGTRPFLVVSNNIGNHFSGIVLGVPLTANIKKLTQPTHCIVGFRKSMVLTEQIYTIKKENINRVVIHLDEEEMNDVDKCLKASLALDGRYYDIDE